MKTRAGIIEVENRKITEKISDKAGSLKRSVK